MPQVTVEKPARLVTERQLVLKRWIWREHDDDPDPPVATGPPRMGSSVLET
jgi:hypothetical protein